jgi:uncharacterized repeat protein (TIGR01451 family)
MAIDAGRDLVYIPGYNPSASSSGIGVFGGSGSASGQITPTRFLTHTTWIVSSYDVKALAVDTTHDRLYVLRTAYADGQVLVFDGISSASGEITPTRIISGPSTLVGKRSLNMALDVSDDRLYVSAYEPDFVMVFDGISSADGDVAPSRVISGPNTTLDFPGGLALDVAADTLYVSNSQKPYHISVFENASTITGDIAPTRVISGSDTGLYYPRALALGAAPDLALIKTPHATEIDPGSAITYSLAYANAMATTASSAFITDTIPAYTSFITCTGGVSCGPAGDVVAWSLGDVPASGNGIVTLTLWLSDTAAPGIVIANTAVFSSPVASAPAIATTEVRVGGWPFDVYLPLVLRGYGP